MKICIVVIGLVICLLARDAIAQQGRAEHVLIISIDGLRPDLLIVADTPNLKEMMSRGCFSMWARTTAQSITLPSHVSMLTGVTPEAHGIQWNVDLPLSEPVYPAVPTIFELAKHRGLTTAMASGKSKFKDITRPGSLDLMWVTSESVGSDPEVTSHAVDFISQKSPNLMFVHLPEVDSTGHKYGWGSKEQLNALALADQCVGQMLDALKKAEILEKTIVIVTADHGGAGLGHGPDDPRSRIIPWIISGPDVRAGFDLTRLGRESNINTTDTFATACYVLGIDLPLRIEGKPLTSVFQDVELMLPLPKVRPAATTQPAR